MRVCGEGVGTKKTLICGCRGMKVIHLYKGETRGGCACVIACNRSSSAHHRVCTFFHPHSTPLVKVWSCTDYSRYGERQSPDVNKRPRGTPTFPTPVRPLHEVAHQGKQLQSQKSDDHATTKNTITLRACTTSSGGETKELVSKCQGGQIINTCVYAVIKMCVCVCGGGPRN